MSRLEEIIERYHFDGSSADMFTRKILHPKDENQFVRDILYMIQTLKTVKQIMDLV